MESVSAPANAMHALHIAIQNSDDIDALQLCLEELGNYKQNSVLEEEWEGRTALSQAILVGNTEAAEFLIKRGAHLNTTSRMYDTQKQVWRSESPLVTAARLGDLVLVKLLVKSGAELDIPDSTLGKTALNWACNRQHSDVAQFLIKLGANINKADFCSETPMTEAIGHRDGIVVSMLVERGVDLDVHVNYDRDTALLFALLVNEPYMAQTLIQAGANVNVMNRNGENCMAAVLWSQLLRDEDLVEYFCNLLIQAGYKVKEEQLQKARAIEDDVCVGMLEKSMYEPLSLASQCRLTIRNRLLELTFHCSIMSRLDRLQIPSRIKDFLKLDIF